MGYFIAASGIRIIAATDINRKAVLVMAISFAMGMSVELGPFQGDVACYTIKKGHGVCGKAWEDKQTVIVPNVPQFPGHIACSSKSRSEIVVPVFKGDDVIAVIDVDSKGYSAFDDIDKDGLEKIAKIISSLFMTC